MLCTQFFVFFFRCCCNIYIECNKLHANLTRVKCHHGMQSIQHHNSSVVTTTVDCCLYVCCLRALIIVYFMVCRMSLSPKKCRNTWKTLWCAACARIISITSSIFQLQFCQRDGFVATFSPPTDSERQWMTRGHWKTSRRQTKFIFLFSFVFLYL